MWFGAVSLVSVGLLLLRDVYMATPRSERLAREQQEIVYGLEFMNRELDQHEQTLGNVAHNDDYIYRVYFEQEPLSPSRRTAGVGGSYRYTELDGLKYRDLLVRTHMKMDQVERKVVVQSASYDQVIKMAENKEEVMAARPAIQPISMKDLVRYGSSFGMRLHPILNIVRPHEGIDLSAPRGTPIYATADGKVLQAGYRAGGFGKKVLLDHGFGYESLYGHCSEILVEPGQEVKRGEVIALVGSTGLSKAPHLHYEVHLNGRAVDPVNYYASDLSAGEYDRMIDMLSKADPSFDIN